LSEGRDLFLEKVESKGEGGGGSKEEDWRKAEDEFIAKNWQSMR
jgi:hypothetical protein